ncbi:histidine phosphatase family protein [Vagococcus carniphilus]|uniref:Histidine phosphatase family protein n=1 Tax=Vagococcus carniphilus TaxID=218144 RepID=A0AAW8U8Y4_9ENTE|nr:histidine phosphatase family protein [Vagococcus carniphilus]MDT2814981.1 histidine phosphatase family protein [Vagococcus carniphilus]MDT2829805.1 histidine phosphatase family protein [Vagococcus carniphilus]MDT2834219.1 histidine phosphatase family protein [Vagococcus carniphilus]MDT2839264.1 histidine phosphatase family protein [Vagococcus carniphilus]MDT2853323.1 histidine phosphatase family protein [Vagococcus carniphilus]
MAIYLIRHGQDDETIRGGWSEAPLTKEGRQQIEGLETYFKSLDISAIYSSDLTRAMETTEILSHFKPEIPIYYDERLREINNGLLAGMPNSQAEKEYPTLYFKQLAWQQKYPKGESPEMFYERISTVWEELSKLSDQNIAIVTHGGVINIILHHVNQKYYSNKNESIFIPTGSITIVD